jgi:hypothetical protein
VLVHGFYYIVFKVAVFYGGGGQTRFRSLRQIKTLPLPFYTNTAVTVVTTDKYLLFILVAFCE